MELLTSLLIFAALCAAVAALASARSPRQVELRLGQLARSRALAANPAAASGPGLVDEDAGWLFRALAPLAGRKPHERAESFERLRLRLQRAGFRRDSALAIFLGSRVALVVLLPLVAALSPLRALMPAGLEQLAPLLALGLGYVAPSSWLDLRSRKRQEAIERELPGALDLMVVCIEAGLGLIQSLARVSSELRRSAPVLAGELELVQLESRAGKSNADALRGLARRSGVREVAVLVAMLTQTERFGTSLADALRVHCDTMRTVRMQRAEELAAKAPLKMLFPTSMILFALMGLILGLAAIRAGVVLQGS